MFLGSCHLIREHQAETVELCGGWRDDRNGHRAGQGWQEPGVCARCGDENRWKSRSCARRARDRRPGRFDLRGGSHRRWSHDQESEGPRALSGGDPCSQNDSFRFFGGLGDLVMTGPTGTNVNDIAVGTGGPSRPSCPRRRPGWPRGRSPGFSPLTTTSLILCFAILSTATGSIMLWIPGACFPPSIATSIG